MMQNLDEAMLSDDELEGMLLQKALDVRMLVEEPNPDGATVFATA